MDRQTLRDLVHRHNRHGIAGLSDGRRSGRPSALSDEQMQELKDLVLAGPDLASDGVVRWRCLDEKDFVDLFGRQLAPTVLVGSPRPKQFPAIGLRGASSSLLMDLHRRGHASH
jgi:Homeodomain-like domain